MVKSHNTIKCLKCLKNIEYNRLDRYFICTYCGALLGNNYSK